MVFKHVYELYFHWLNNQAYSKLKTLFVIIVYRLSYKNFNPANKVNLSICEHKIIFKPVYTIYDIQFLLQFQILVYVDILVSNSAVVILKTSIKMENSRWNPRWLPAIEMVLCDFLIFILCI